MATVALMRLQQRQAHENPVIFYSVIIGSIGPVLAITVPPIRERYGYRPAEMIPTSYPRSYKSRHLVFFTSLNPHFGSQCLTVRGDQRKDTKIHDFLRIEGHPGLTHR